MRFFIAVAVAALGIGCYAVAALLYDRRQHVVAWLQRRRAVPSGAGRVPVPVGMSSPSVLYLAIAACLVFGTLLVAGSCLGLIAF